MAARPARRWACPATCPASQNGYAANAERQQQEAQRRERALHACELWSLAAEAGEAPYLARKGLSGPHGARFAPGGVPSAGQALAVCGRMV